ncbi:MAG: DNA helicase RecQ [Bacteroidales bacterium]|jgi:ATP-dependent DNA helicase RecQ|nr:DNA helicase RecQ [Bacteroidales bacterium]
MTVSKEAIHQKLKKFFGFDSFKGNQEEIITHLIGGGDAFVLMPTGGGKSLCYQLPALCLPGCAIVISPLIALMKNQVDALREFVQSEDSSAIAHFLNSSLSKTQIQQVRADLTAGRTKLLYVAPESLTKEENIAMLKTIPISFYAIDEAHCISEWGHDFRPEYRRINEIVSQIGKAPMIALTATATPKVQSDIQKNLGMTHAKVFKSSFNRPNLYYEIRDKTDAKREIIKFIKENPGKSGIIYCLSRKKVEELSELLNVNGIKARPYHAGLDAATRAANQDDFLMERADVIVATIAFGMGIDKPDVRFVIHYDVPKSLEGYYQETGRAGRDGGEGKCITFYNHKDIQKLEKFMQGKPISEQEIGKQLLLDVVSYAESNQCRRKILLNYFGEDYNQDNCGCCDNCLYPKEQFDGQKDMLNVMELILSLKENFKTEHLADILAGVSNSIIKSYNHHKHPLFGIGREKGQRFWAAVIRQGLVLHLLDKDIDKYGLINITAKGMEFRRMPYPIMLTEQRSFAECDDDDDDNPIARNKPVGGGGGDQTLLKVLKSVRENLSRKLNLPPWVIFADPSLEDMSILYPITLEELHHCQGVGEGKARKFGGEFIKVISQYVEDNDILRPDDILVRNVANKSANKIFIIQSIDRKMPFEDICQMKGMDMSELLDEIESIVNSGTRINIDYYIHRAVDPDDMEDIYEYFREEAHSDSIDEAMRDLGDYDEIEVRLVRIKFISEIGN